MRTEAVVDQSKEGCEGKHGPSPRWQLAAAVVVILALGAAIVFLPVTDWLRTAVIWTSDLGWVGMVLFVGLYAIAATLTIPVTPLNIGSGVLFGWWIGFLLAMAGGIGAAVLSLLLARFLLKDWVRRHLACYPTPAAFIDDVHERPWSAIITLRLHPFIPAIVKNYCFGISDVRIGTYIAATTVAYAPVIFLHSYLGAAGYTTVEHGHEWTTTEQVLYMLAIAGVIALAIVLTWYGKRRIDEVKQRRAAR